MTEVKRFACDPDCGFAIQSHDEREVMDVAKKHVKQFHQQVIGDDYVKTSWKNVMISA